MKHDDGKTDAGAVLTPERLSAWRQNIRSSTFAHYHTNMAAALLRGGAVTHADAAIRRALAEEPSNPHALYLLDQLEGSSGTVDKAVMIRGALIQGHQSRRAGFLPEAKAAYSQAMALNPATAEGALGLYLVQCLDKSETRYVIPHDLSPDDDGQEIAELVREIIRFTVSVRHSAPSQALLILEPIARIAGGQPDFDLHYMRLLQMLLRLEKAASFAHGVLSVQPDRMGMLILLAEIRLAEGNHAEAETLIRNVPVCGTGAGDRAVILASVLIRQGKAEAARETCLEALQGEPGHLRLRSTLGLSYAALGQLDQALAEQEAVLSRSLNPHALLNTALVHEMAGQSVAADDRARDMLSRPVHRFWIPFTQLVRPLGRDIVEGILRRCGWTQ